MSNNRVVWLAAEDPPERFPPVSAAMREPDGLLAAGGDLGTARLLYAYENGIFPWYEEGQPILWWAPDPRCVFLPDDFHVARRLGREVQKSGWEIRVNTAFAQVIRACAGPRRSQQGTWITARMRAAFEKLRAEGWAHSIEVWDGEELAGGLYGLAIGSAFFGESMFSHRPNASKFALLYLSNRLQNKDFDLLDCQVESAHLMGLGAQLISRCEFSDRLKAACVGRRPFTDWPIEPLPCQDLLVNRGDDALQ